MTNPRDCEHGHLARSCESCAWDREREELRTLLRQALDALESFKLPEHSVLGAKSGCLILSVPFETVQKQAAAYAAIKEALK